MTFDAIATELLSCFGYEALECSSDVEAIEESRILKNGGKAYPVHYSVSDTSGEKEFEEFYTENETVDLNRFFSLGVITGKKEVDRERIRTLFYELNEAFSKDQTTKEEIISILKGYLSNFKHIEKGKSLDSKM